ncbi:collagen binding domain-containing protein [Cohnella cellulosilytica]|uniref:Collagen binding domain-containing protein n=1 Tax=Cohnella cellulosilytica TaxID=986710 RepID=A0ABW2FAD5_9BACL
MKKRIYALGILFLLIFNVFAGGSALYAAEGEETVAAPATAIEDNILTKVTLKDAHGSVIDAVYNPDYRFEIGSAVHLEFEWELPNGHGYKAGDTFAFDLPSEFAIYTEIDGPLANGDETVGSFTVDRGGRVVMTFNDYVENHSNVKGGLKIVTEFSVEIVKGSEEVVIPIPVRDGLQTVVVVLKPNVDATIDKTGRAAADNSRIDWTIDINKKLEEIEQATVSDPMPEGLKLIADSVNVYRLQVNADGSTVKGAPVGPEDYALEAFDDRFELKFAHPIDRAYRIEYSTDVAGGQSKFVNTATLSGTDIENAQATATVTIERGKRLDKAVGRYDSSSGIIDWTIRYNFSGDSIPQVLAWLKDVFGSAQKLVPGSFKVFQGDTGDAADPGLYVLAETADGFELQFLSDVTSSYRIEYQTQPSSRPTVGDTIKNVVTDGLGGKAEASQRHKQGAIVKSHKSANYKEKTAKWEIKINTDTKPDGSHYVMKNVEIADSFTNGGLELIPDSLKITDSLGQELAAGTDYTLVYTDLKAGFVIVFAHDVADAYTIGYETKFDVQWLKDASKRINNKAVVTWTDENGSEQEATAEVDFDLNRNTKNNGGKSGTYNAQTKEITWTVLINYNRDKLAGASVSDKLLQGQKLAPGTVKLYPVTVKPDGGVQQGTDEVPADEYAVELPTADNDNVLTVLFNGEISSAYWLTFKTTLEGSLIEREIYNYADLLIGGVKKTTWDAKITVPNGGQYVGKFGVQNGKSIDWTIRINEGQSYLTNVKIVDKPTPNQELVADSFRLYATSVKSDGSIAEAGELTKDEDFTLQIRTDADGAQSFELAFQAAISKPYILKYSSLIQANDKDKVGNTVYLEGDGLTTELREKMEEIVVRTSSGSGSGSGETGALQVVKVDSADPAKALAGAEFTLIDKSGNRAPRAGTTDEKGELRFGNLLFGDYVLEETKAPEGYTIDRALYDVTIDSSTVDGTKTFVLTIANNKTSIPGNPGNPGNPGEPVDPTAPADPETPVDPGEPTEEIPGHPAEPGEPVEPGQSTEPEEPGEELVEIPGEEIPLGGADPEPEPGSSHPGGPGVLPKTGESSPLPYYASGAALVAMGLWFGFNRSVRRKSS